MEPENQGTEESGNPDYWILIYVLRIPPDFLIPEFPGIPRIRRGIGEAGNW